MSLSSNQNHPTVSVFCCQILVKLLPNGQPDYAKTVYIYRESFLVRSLDQLLSSVQEKMDPIITKVHTSYSRTRARRGNEIVLPELKPIFDNGRLIELEVVKEAILGLPFYQKFT